MNKASFPEFFSISLYPLTEAGIEAADVYNHGGGITAMDAVTIQMVDTGLIDQSMLPVSATDLN